MNCNYNDRPSYAKKRYFFLMAMLGLGSKFRWELEYELYEYNYMIEKHV